MGKNKIDVKKNHLSWEKTIHRKCDKDDCNKKGEFKAPKSRLLLNDKIHPKSFLGISSSCLRGLYWSINAILNSLSYK